MTISAAISRLRGANISTGNGFRVDMYFHFIGNGKWEKVKSKYATADTPDFNLEMFSTMTFSKKIRYKGADYLYEDCVREAFVRDGVQVIVVHARYFLDLDYANFHEFIEKAVPSDFARVE